MIGLLVFPPETEKGMVIFLQNGHFQRAWRRQSDFEARDIPQRRQRHFEALTIYSKIPLLRLPKIKTKSTLKADWEGFSYFLCVYYTYCIMLRDKLWDYSKSGLPLKDLFWTVPKVVSILQKH